MLEKDTRDFVTWINTISDQLVPVPKEFDLSDSVDIQYDPFDDDLEGDIRDLEIQIKDLEEKLMIKLKQEELLQYFRLIRKRQQERQRESIQLKRLMQLKKEQLNELDQPFSRVCAEFFEVLDGIQSTLDQVDSRILQLNFDKIDLDDLVLKDWQKGLTKVYENARRYQSESIKESIDQQEFKRLSGGLCQEKQREFELSCWKVYYSSFFDPVFESSQTVKELQDLIVELMKFDVEQWFMTEWQEPMERATLEQQIKIQEQCLEFLDPFLVKANRFIQDLEANSKILDQESKSLISHHFHLSKTTKKVQELLDIWKSALPNYQEYQEQPESKFIDLKGIPVLQLFGDKSTDGLYHMDPLLSQCKSFAETVHTDHDRVTSDIKRVYQLSLQIAQRKRYIAELLFQTNLKYEPVITKMESQIQQSVDKLDPIVRYLSTKV